jgi:hypothetical protein
MVYAPFGRTNRNIPNVAPTNQHGAQGAVNLRCIMSWMIQIKRNMVKMGEGGVVHHWDLPYDVWSVFTVFELII